MITQDDASIYYFKLNNVLTRLSKPTAQWISSNYTHDHRKGKRMYRTKDSTKDLYKYSFCEILFDVKHRTECIVLKETPCYVTLAVLSMKPGTSPINVTRTDFFSRRRWKSSELKRTKHFLANIQELHDYAYDLDVLFKDLTLETVKSNRTLK